MEFNLLLRFFTVALGFFLVLAAMGFGVEGIAAERRRETWSSLLETPLDGREVLRAKLLGTLWRFRLGIGTLVLLWMLGLFTGSIHPLGFVLSLLVISSWMWFAAIWGMVGATRAEDATRAGNTNGIRRLRVMLLNGTAALPLLLPTGLSSVLLGSCSPLLVLWITQFSYREFTI